MLFVSRFWNPHKILNQYQKLFRQLQNFMNPLNPLEPHKFLTHATHLPTQPTDPRKYKSNYQIQK